MIMHGLRQEDFSQLNDLLKAQGFDYELPERDALSVAMGVEENGKYKMAILARPTVELYMLSDSSWGTPGLLAARAEDASRAGSQGVGQPRRYRCPRLAPAAD